MDAESPNKDTSKSDYPSRLLFLPHGIKRFEKIGFVKAFPKGSMVAAQGSLVKHCYVVKKGRVISYELTPSGEKQIYNFMEEGSLMLEVNLLFDKITQVNFVSTVDSQLICISKTSLVEAMQDDQQLTFDIMESISGKFFSSMDQLRQERYHSAEWKICNLLLIFAEKFGTAFDNKILITEKLSQQTISNLLGLNRITTVRIMKEMKQQGLIACVNGYYHIISIDMIKEHMTAILLQKR